MATIGLGLTNPLIVDFNTFGMTVDRSGGTYWSLDFSGPSIIIALATGEDDLYFDNFNGGGWTAHVLKGGGGGFWGVTNWLSIGVGVNYEWGGVLIPSIRRAESMVSLGADIPIVFNLAQDLFLALVPHIEWLYNLSTDDATGWRVGVDAKVAWRPVGPLILYGKVGFQHVGAAFKGVGTAPVYGAGIGLDLAWFFR